MFVDNDSAVFEVTYYRQHGVHSYVTNDGMPITALSFPTWEEYFAALKDLPESDGYIVSPELITSPVPLGQIPGRANVIDERQDLVRKQSVRHPWARVLLSSTITDEAGLHNVVFAFHDGKTIETRTKQVNPMNAEEASIFQNSTEPNPSNVGINGHEVLICSDLIQAAASAMVTLNAPPRVAEISRQKLNRWIAPCISSLLLIACWGVPLPDHIHESTEPEQKYLRALVQCVDFLMRARPSLHDIIVVDRAIQGHGVEPFNAHFRRLVD